MLPEPLMETESAGRNIRTRQLQSSNSSFRAGTSLAVSPWTQDFRTARRAPTWFPCGYRGETGTGVCSAFLVAPWQEGDWEQTLIHCTTPAYNAVHATFGNPATMQQGSPALLAVLNSSGNCFDECSNHKGFITHPLPSSA